MPSPIPIEVVLSDEERVQLEAWARRGKSAQALAQRSRIVLAAAEGLNNTEIGQRLGLDLKDGTEVALTVRARSSWWAVG